MPLFQSPLLQMRRWYGGFFASAFVILAVAPAFRLMAQQAASRPVTTKPADDATQPWSNTAANLRARFVAQSGSLKAGEQPSIAIESQNASHAAIIYQCFGVDIQMPQLQDPNVSITISRNTAGNGARLLTEAEVMQQFGVRRQQYQPDALMPDYYELQPGGSVLISDRLQWIIAKPGEYRVTGSVPCVNPMSGLVSQNMLFLPDLTLKAEPGDPAAAAAYDIHWGAATNGLRAGLKFEDGFRPVKQFAGAGWACIVENTTDNPISLTYATGTEQEDLPVVKDGKGAGLPVTMQRVDVDMRTYNMITLAPHKSTKLTHTRLWIVPSDSNESKVYTPILRANPGDYQVSFTFRYKPQGADEWTGALSSGPAPLRVIKGNVH
jgi:hypothetical protein